MSRANIMRMLLLMGLLGGILSGSVAGIWARSITSAECSVMRVAERHIALHFSDFNSVESPPILKDTGDTWLVYYKLPEDTLGGTPEVIIDKRTLKVVRAYHTQ
jgi:NTF2 fold immunity protein